MSKFELKLPQMGESVAEATLTSWLKEVGDTIEMDEAVFEIATDKVDSEVPSEVEGTLIEKKFKVDDVIKVGEVVAVIEIEGKESGNIIEPEEVEIQENVSSPVAELEGDMKTVQEKVLGATPDFSDSERFYSPLVKNIAKQEGISLAELNAITGTGKEGRVTKNDILNYIDGRGKEHQGAGVSCRSGHHILPEHGDEDEVDQVDSIDRHEADAGSEGCHHHMPHHIAGGKGRSAILRHGMFHSMY